MLDNDPIVTGLGRVPDSRERRRKYGCPVDDPINDACLCYIVSDIELETEELLTHRCRRRLLGRFIAVGNVVAFVWALGQQTLMSSVGPKEHRLSLYWLYSWLWNTMCRNLKAG